MSHDIVILTGSPSPTSRSALVARAFAAEVERRSLRARTWSLGDFDPGDVVSGRADAPALAGFVDAVRSARGLVLATPVYKAAYAGALKAIVDVIPPDALVGRSTLGIATARLAAHEAEVDRAYRALFAFFKARYAGTLFVLDEDVAAAAGALSAPAEQRIRIAARELVAAIAEAPQPATAP